MDAEKTLGAEIHPAAGNQSFTQEGRDDDDCKFHKPQMLLGVLMFGYLVCRELDAGLGGGRSICGANAKGQLDW